MPISLISNLAKVLEKTKHRRLYKFMKECKIISYKQYVDLKNGYTNDALSFINNLICDEIDKNESVIAAFLDLAKAFDNDNHEILINKLDNYGVEGKMLDQVESYLANRYKYLRIINTISTKDELFTSVHCRRLIKPIARKTADFNKKNNSC